MTKYIYPPGKRVRSLSARGPFDSLIFYYDLTLHPEDFCFIFGGWWWMVDSGWGATFWFNSLDNNIVYRSGIDIYMYIKGIRAEQKSSGF